MDQTPHRCHDGCRCPIHSTLLLCSPAGDEHACQDPQCQYAHGLETTPLAADGTPLPHLRGVVKTVRVAGLSDTRFIGDGTPDSPYVFDPEDLRGLRPHTDGAEE